MVDHGPGAIEPRLGHLRLHRRLVPLFDAGRVEPQEYVLVENHRCGQARQDSRPAHESSDRQQRCDKSEDDTHQEVVSAVVAEQPDDRPPFHLGQCGEQVGEQPHHRDDQQAQDRERPEVLLDAGRSDRRSEELRDEFAHCLSETSAADDVTKKPRQRSKARTGCQTSLCLRWQNGLVVLCGALWRPERATKKRGIPSQAHPSAGWSVRRSRRM
jgi:hypothetical protein